MLNYKSKFFNKSIATVLSAVVAGWVPIQAASCNELKSDKALNVSAQQANSSKISEWIKRHWLISGIAGCVGVDLILGTTLKYGIRIGEVVLKTLTYKLLVDQYKENFLQTFSATMGNQYTKKQEGIAWCWLACIQGLLKYHGIELSQENMFKMICKTNPKYFEAERQEPLLTGIMFKIANSPINALLNNTNLKLKEGLIRACDFDNGNKIREIILDYYNSIGNQPFCIIDSFAGAQQQTGSGLRLMHLVNVVNIDTTNNTITLEDPQIGLSRTEDLDEYCNRYFNGGKVFHDAIDMFSLVNSSAKVPDQIYYFSNSNSNSVGGSCFKKICC